MKNKEPNPPGLRERNGKWYYRINSGCHETSRSTGLKANRGNIAEALRLRQEAMGNLETGRPAKLTEILFSEAAVLFLKWHKGEAKRLSTHKRTRGSLGSASEFFKDKMAGRITPGDIEDYKEWRRLPAENGGCGVQEITILHDLLNLSLFFKYGLKKNWCRSNPIKEVEKPSGDVRREHVFSEDEEKAYFAAALKRSQDLYDVCRIMLRQGCRPEEVRGLPTAKVNFGAGTFYVEYGKSKAAKRHLLMHAETREILKNRRKGMWCFPSEDSASGHIENIAKAHDFVADEIKCDCVIYDWRHTFATRAAAGGMPIQLLSKIMGHSNIMQTMRYVHLDQEAADKAMRQMWEQKQPAKAAKEGKRAVQ